jgi:hypothetical protein
MTIGGEDVFHVETLAIGISLGLLHAREGVFTFFLGLQHGDGQRLGHHTELDTEQIVGATRSFAAAAFGPGGFDGRRRQNGFKRDLRAADIAFGAQQGVDQVVAGIRLVHDH